MSRFTRYIEKVAQSRGLATEWGRNVENGMTSFEQAVREAEKSAEFWMEAIDGELEQMVRDAVEHALCVAIRHVGNGQPLETLNVMAIAAEALKLWKEKNDE